ncbi:DUF551 domain-containing protein [Escherichia coli]|nr:DUF551 domain-containing protein [Escherichia coli]EFB2036019.1 DUF551 domain-containing protein [Escherichia coli]EFN7408698.1 DUF551 domain-containing protein [Escherichia coli]EIC1181440.1 DUF551 domain-containing protein [Escherichia coli]ELA3486241.1 DUF551 domain-containing protein [Escherichia coli]
MTTITREQALKIIEAADEVISALAGTNEDVHPGSDNMLRLWDDLNDRYAPPEVVRELARIALASLEAEPVGAFHIAEQQVDGTSDYLKDGEWPIDNGIIEVYAAPPVPVVPAALPENDDEDGHDIDYLEPSEVYALGRTAGWNACRAAMLQSGNFRENKNSSTNNFREIAETSTNSPVIPDGLSTVCAEAYQVVGVMADALGVFGDAAVQKVLDNLSQQKLVHRDVLPFSLPVTPDGWISCSDRMPEKNQNVLISVNFDSDLVEPLICSARYTGSTFRRGQATIKPGNGIEQATHWMPLPEPPQEVK